MPSGYKHEKLCKKLIRNPFENVHKWKDEPVLWLGRYHREFRHGLSSIWKVGRRFKGRGNFNWGASLASFIHDVQDGVPGPTFLTVGVGTLLLIGLCKFLDRQSSPKCPYCPQNLQFTQYKTILYCSNCHKYFWTQNERG